MAANANIRAGRFTDEVGRETYGRISRKSGTAGGDGR